MKKTKKIIGITHGVFDLFHIGHLNLLKNAKSKCDELVVLVAADEKVFKEKGRYPIIPQKERMEIIENIKYVDKVVLQPYFDIEGDYKKYKFSKVFKGDDWKGSDKWNKAAKYLTPYGVKIVFLPYTKTTSSTLIRDQITDDLQQIGKRK